MADRAALNAAADPISMVVDLGALRKNYQTLKNAVGHQIHIIASIKGDGYGIGAAESAKVLHEVGAYAVATGSIHDALAIRASGNPIKIHLFPGVLPEAMPLLYEHHLTPSIYDMALARAASNAAMSPWGVFIKVDAGFGRLGVPVAAAKDFALAVAALPNLRIEGLFTHVPFGDAAGKAWAAQAFAAFDALIAALEAAGLRIPVTQCVASGSALQNMQGLTRCNTVCVGHLLYGGLGREPLGAEKTSVYQPVIRQVSGRIIHLRRHAQHTAMGSGGKLRAAPGMVTATIPIGLHEGYRAAAAGNTAFALLRGVRVPVLFVSQEYTVLDVTTVPDAAIGDAALLWGGDGAARISVEELACWQGQTPLHVVMNMNRRVPCTFVHAQGEVAHPQECSE